MGAIELNEALATFMVKPGDPGKNPNGNQGTKEYRSGLKEFRKCLRTAFAKPSTIPGREGMTRWESMVDETSIRAERGERWFIRFSKEQMEGREPFRIDLHTTTDLLAHKTDAELLDCVERLRDQLRARIANTIDAVVVEQK
jgi:hypothetical protein